MVGSQAPGRLCCLPGHAPVFELSRNGLEPMWRCSSVWKRFRTMLSNVWLVHSWRFAHSLQPAQEQSPGELH
eukprot:20857-Pyramimonas_sp.AAC.1